MINLDYKKSEDIAKESLEGVFSITDKITMQVQETQDEFIFRTLINFLHEQTNIIVRKDELIKAISLFRMVEEHGPGIYQCWATAAAQSSMLSDSYRLGFQDGVKKEHDRIMDVLKELEEELEFDE